MAVSGDSHVGGTQNMNPGSEGIPVASLSPIDLLIEQAGAQARELQRERAEIGRSSVGRPAPALKALEVELAQTWSAIRSMRSPGNVDTEGIRRRSKWR